MASCANTSNIVLGQPAPHPWDSPHADVVIRTTDLINFSVHRDVLSFASTTFKDRTVSLDPSTSHCTRCPCGPKARGDRLPIIHVAVTSHVLNVLLRHIYPVDTIEVTEVTDVFAVLKAAREYTVASVAKKFQAQVSQLAQSKPLEVHAHAARYKWEEEMRTAARASLSHTVEGVYVTQMEDNNAGTYFRLLTYHRECSQIASAVVNDLGWWKRLSQAEATVPRLVGLQTMHQVGSAM